MIITKKQRRLRRAIKTREHIRQLGVARLTIHRTAQQRGISLMLIKAKFGDSLRSKTKTAQINEALCKVLCHNICCLIQSMYELNLKTKFWAEVA